MKLLVRTTPIRIYYVTGPDAEEIREDGIGAPCFTTESFGQDGFVWETAEQFEESYNDAHPPGPAPAPAPLSNFYASLSDSEKAMLRMSFLRLSNCFS